MDPCAGASQVRWSAWLFGLLPIVYALTGWWVTTGVAAAQKGFLLWYLLVSHGALCVPYILLLRMRRPPLALRWGIVVCLIAPLVTPSLLQTDQLRYVFDGLMLSSGRNPFARSPAEVLESLKLQGWVDTVPLPSGLQVPDAWVRAINHPTYVTVYSPLSQLAFAFGAWLNPFFRIPSINAYFGSWMELFPVVNWWPWECGWRLVVALACAATVGLLRGQRWDLVLFHPLVFLTVFANVRVDALLLPALALLFRATCPRAAAAGVGGPRADRSGPVLAQAGVLGLALLVRWTPMAFVPAWVQFWYRRSGTWAALRACVLALSLVVVGFALFWPGSEGRLFASAATYTEHWMFFGFAHLFVSDLVAATGWSSDPIRTVKIALAAIWCLASWYLLVRAWRLRLHPRLVSLLLLMGWMVVMPTLHPWYFVPLVLVGLPYYRVLVTPWLWPLLAPLSYTFYFGNSDPTVVRMIVYLLVAGCLIRDVQVVLSRPRIFSDAHHEDRIRS